MLRRGERPVPQPAVQPPEEGKGNQKGGEEFLMRTRWVRKEEKVQPRALKRGRKAYARPCEKEEGA